MAHETYQDLEIEIICFEADDVIIVSDLSSPTGSSGADPCREATEK